MSTGTHETPDTRAHTRPTPTAAPAPPPAATGRSTAAPTRCCATGCPRRPPNWPAAPRR
ncbi:hypothetical protein ACR6C2_35265 [Streptomyces sp. INA 01156]